MNCKKSMCFVIPDGVPTCIRTLRIRTYLEGQEVTLRFTDQFKKRYLVTKTSDAQGEVVLQISNVDALGATVTPDLPYGLLNEYAGRFMLVVDQFTFMDCNGQDYPCVAFEVKKTKGGPSEHLIDLTDCGQDKWGEYQATEYSGEFNI